MPRERALKNPTARIWPSGKRPSRVPHRRPALRAAQRRELIAYFERRVAALQIVATTETPGGQILDWIPIASQHPAGEIATPPPAPAVAPGSLSGHETRQARFELEEGGRRGPDGTVPVLRTDTTKLRFHKTLDEHLSKHGHDTVDQSIDGFSFAQPQPGSLLAPHDYAATDEPVACYGGDGFISVFDPYTARSDEFSLSQIAVISQFGPGPGVSNYQTVEAGWQEFRDLYGDWIPHLFIFYTTNGYARQGNNIGGYNQMVDGWVQYSPTIYPGAISNTVSIPGGAQWELFIKYQLFQGNWWLRVGHEWIGYYPASLFSDPGLRNQARRVNFYGEIVDATPTSTTRTQMGTGYYPQSEWPYAAFQRLLKYQRDAAGTMADYGGGSIVTDAREYDLESHMNSGTTWGSYFWFGGPGG